LEAIKDSLDSVIKNRTVIPRWKSPQGAIEAQTFDKKQLSDRTALGDPWIKRLIAAFEQFPSPSTAHELYETALLYKNDDCLSPAARELARPLREAARLPEGMPLQYNASTARAAFDLVGDSVDVHEEAARLEIHRLRRLLGETPDRPFCWSELSRNFLVVGEDEKAIRCMQAALKLATRNRYLYRAATRLFVHVQDPERALTLLRSGPGIGSDPWLLAAEIATATASKKTSRYIDIAKQSLLAPKLQEYQLSELAAAVGTVELMNGANKRARKLFNFSLVAPTENSLAQAQWAVEQESRILIPASAWQTPASYEAKTLALRRKRDWPNAISACAAWLAEEPFSIRPALVGSHMAFRPEHQRKMEQFATAGLRRDSDNFALLNNRAVARAYQGRIQDAYSDVQKALQHAPGRNDAHLMATLGLIAFRSGLPELGREYYELSIAWFSVEKKRASTAAAALYLAREEMRTNQSAIPLSVALAKDIARSSWAIRHPELIGMTELVIEEARTPANTKIALNSESAVVPTSLDDLRRQASLFRVPDKAKQLAPRLRGGATIK